MHAIDGVVGVGLIAVDLGPEQVGIELQATVPQGALETELGVIGALGADQQRVGAGNRCRAYRQIDPAGLFAMGQGGVCEQVVGDAVAEVQQTRRAGAVLIQIAGVEDASASTSCRSRRTGNRCTTHRGITGDIGAFLFIGAT
ncbi:hypothetical protein D3C78_1490620 [compost metagenome]